MSHANFGGCLAFIVAVIQFVQIRLYPSDSAKPCQLTSASRTLEWTREHVVKLNPLQQSAELRSPVFTVFCQRQVSVAGVLASE